MIISGLQLLARPIFGEFEREEFKKFLRMGVIFALILGTYWTLRVMKDSVFEELVGKDFLPYAKGVSLVLLFPLVMGYSKLLDRFSRERMFYVLSMIYGIGTTLAAIGLIYTEGHTFVPGTASARLAEILGYAIYVFVESYGSLVVALFWAFASDITDPASAKKGFYLTTALGQVGGIVGPRYITQIPGLLGYQTSAAAFFATVALIISVSILMRYFVTHTPKHLMVSYHGKNEAKVEEEQEPGFFEGLRLLVSHKYLLGIFFAIASYETIVTIFDFNFKYLAMSTYSGHALREYLGSYGSYVNTVSLACLLLGVSNITRVLGVGVALILMPILVGCAVTGFLTMDSLQFLFWLMVGSKAVNYALNGPAMKQLYIPTTPDVRFKSQAWIETFGSRGSKGIGSYVNSFRPALMKIAGIGGLSAYMVLCGVVGYSLVLSWLLVAIFLGRTFNKATEKKQVIC